MENKYIDKVRKKDLNEFINLCKSLNMDFDVLKFESIALNTIKYINGDKEKRDELRYIQELENKWYDSIKNGFPDYSIYDDVYYLADTWVCWKMYSREYLKSIISNKSLATKIDGVYNPKSIKDEINKINKIADLGCGIGYSTATLKQEFNCEVFGTNLKNTNQYKICEKISKLSGFNLVETLEEVGFVDMVFASEYFEHFERPIEHLIDVIIKLNPKHILFANTFNAKSIGHFDTYKHYDKNFNGKEISKLFTKTLNEHGFFKVKTNCWNNRPNYYKLNVNDGE